jgi:hypothetical protein
MSDDIVDNPIDLHTANTMLNQHPDMRDPSVVCFFLVGQAAIAWLLLRLQDDHAWQGEALKPTILPQYAAFWQLVLSFVGNPLIVCLPCIGRAQKPDPSRRIDEQHILDRMVFLLATVVDFLLITIFRPSYRSFGTIVAKKGGASGSSCAPSACNWAANSAAVRAGSKSWLAKAWFRMSSSSRTHLLTFG